MFQSGIPKSCLCVSNFSPSLHMRMGSGKGYNEIQKICVVKLIGKLCVLGERCSCVGSSATPLFTQVDGEL